MHEQRSAVREKTCSWCIVIKLKIHVDWRKVELVLSKKIDGILPRSTELCKNQVKTTFLVPPVVSLSQNIFLGSNTIPTPFFCYKLLSLSTSRRELSTLVLIKRTSRIDGLLCIESKPLSWVYFVTISANRRSVSNWCLIQLSNGKQLSHHLYRIFYACVMMYRSLHVDDK